MPLVSIILPYYKKINYFEKTYKSVLGQSYKNFELIIIYDDQNRTDLTKILKIIKNNPKVRIFCNKKNLGAGLSRNVGIKKSKGSLISFIDADDLWSKNKISKQVKFILKNKYKFICCNYKKKFKNNLVKVSPKKKISYSDLIKNCQIGLSTVMLKREIINEKLFPQFKTQEDLSAWLKIMRIKKIACYNLNEFLVIWRYDKKSLSSNFFQKFKDLYKVFNIYENFSLIKTITCVFILSLNSIQRKF